MLRSYGFSVTQWGYRATYMVDDAEILNTNGLSPLLSRLSTVVDGKVQDLLCKAIFSLWDFKLGKKLHFIFPFSVFIYLVALLNVLLNHFRD